MVLVIYLITIVSNQDYLILVLQVLIYMTQDIILSLLFRGYAVYSIIRGGLDNGDSLANILAVFDNMQ